jgi:predicted esterase
VPKKYNAKQRVPLVISLHGGGSDTHRNLPEATRSAGTEISYWSKGCEDLTAILLAPTTTDEYWAVDRGREIILSTLQYACDHFEIDTDRVVLSGSSLGGFGTFWWAPLLADRLALAAPFIGGPDVRDRLGNCRNLPMHVMIGSLDEMMYMKEWVRDNVAALKKLGYDVVFHEHPNLGHRVPAEEGPQVLAKLMKTPRNLCAKRLTRTMGSGAWYWIEAEGRLEATLSANAISVQGPKAARILLSDAMVDLEKPVRVELNGSVRFEGKVERSLGLMIDQLRKYQDPSRAFCASIDVK